MKLGRGYWGELLGRRYFIPCRSTWPQTVRAVRGTFWMSWQMAETVASDRSRCGACLQSSRMIADAEGIRR